MPSKKSTKIPSKILGVVVVQNSAGPMQAENLDTLQRMLAHVPRSDIIALPEVFAARGGDDDLRKSAKAIPSDLSRWLAALASKQRCWVLAGSVLEQHKGSIYNTCLVFDRQGKIRARYRKIHLFEARLDDGRVIREQSLYEAGARPVLVNIEGWVCGLSICYDLRFPELYRLYSSCGAHLMFAPANFTRRTGKDHWEILVRSRAIENQCFVVAPNQCGKNRATGVISHGHSLVVAPWGETLVQAGSREICMSAMLDPALLREARGRVPVLLHRKITRVICP